MFAFLNNAHEANIAVYTPDEQMQRAEIFRQIREIEADLQHRHPDWRERMAAWEEQVADDQPEWIVVRPDVEDDSTGGQKYLPLDDGSFLAQGYAPTKHTVKHDGARPTSTTITAFRLELLNDPNLPLGGPGPVDQGDVRPDRVRGRGRAGRCARQDDDRSSSPRPRPTSTRRRRRWSRSSTTRAASGA